jgi:hypothetical protein
MRQGYHERGFHERSTLPTILARFFFSFLYSNAVPVLVYAADISIPTTHIDADKAADTLDIMRPLVKATNPNADKWMGIGHDMIAAIQDQQKRAIEEMKKSKLPFRMIDELTNSASADLAKSLPEIPEVKASETQKVLEIGSMTNKTGDQDQAFAAAMASIRTRLANNEAVTNSYVLVDRTSDQARQATTQAAETAGGNTSVFDDPLGRHASTTAKVVYNPRDIYVTSSEFYSLDDDGGKDRTVTFKLMLKVSHPQSGQVVYDKAFTKVYRWSTDKKKFVPDA